MATGSGACGFGVQSRAGLIQQFAAIRGPAPCTPKPGHLTRSPRLGGVGSAEERQEQSGIVCCKVTWPSWPAIRLRSTSSWRQRCLHILIAGSAYSTGA